MYQVHSDRINQFDYLSTTIVFRRNKLGSALRRCFSVKIIMVGKAVGMYVALGDFQLKT
jgi:hypothetical protein